MNNGELLYEETKNSRFTIVALLMFCIFCFFAFIYESVLKLGQIGNFSVPDWLYLSLLLFLIICLFTFKAVKIRITAQEINVGFNTLFSQRIIFEDIEKVEIDDKSYSSGLRIHFVKGKFRIIYNAGQPRVVISIKNKRKEIAFSTNKPHQVIEIIESKIKE